MAIISRKSRRSRRNAGGPGKANSNPRQEGKAPAKVKGKTHSFRNEMFRLADRKKGKKEESGGKMKVGKPGDRFEQEAEAVAASVVDRDGGGTALGNVLKTSEGSGLNKMEEEKPAQTMTQKAEEPEAQAMAGGAVQKEEEEESAQNMQMAEEEAQAAEEPEAQMAEEEAQAMIQKGGSEEEESAQNMQMAEEEAQAAEEPEAQMAEEEAQAAEEPEAQMAEEEAQAAEEPEAQMAEEEAQAAEEPEAQMAEEEAQALVQKKGDTQVPSEEFTDAVRLAKQDGRPLPTEIRHQMETAFGADFSQVRVHTDSESVRLTSALGAQAFTNGNHIFFNMGKFDPSTSKGRHLLAHELTHTLQQGAVERKSVLTGSSRVVTRKKEEEEEEEEPMAES